MQSASPTPRVAFTSAPPRGIVARAFVVSGEKHRWLASLFYRALFGRPWSYAFLGFAYMKYIDRRADGDPDHERAHRFLAAQRTLLSRTYAGTESAPDVTSPERCGYEVFRYDAESGGALRPMLEEVLEAIAADLGLRGRVRSAAEIEAWGFAVGAPSIRYLAHFAAPGYDLSRSFVELACRAYLHADCLIDLDEDLRIGLISVPAEEIERLSLHPVPDDASLARWVAARTPAVLAEFERALAETRRLPLRLRLLGRLYLGRKRRALLRFAAGVAQGAASGSR